jgi:hypothetical protein
MTAETYATTTPITGLSTLRVGATVIHVSSSEYEHGYGVIMSISGPYVLIDTADGTERWATVAEMCDWWRIVA